MQDFAAALLRAAGQFDGRRRRRQRRRRQRRRRQRRPRRPAAQRHGQSPSLVQRRPIATVKNQSHAHTQQGLALGFCLVFLRPISLSRSLSLSFIDVDSGPLDMMTSLMISSLLFHDYLHWVSVKFCSLRRVTMRFFSNGFCFSMKNELIASFIGLEGRRLP